MARKLTGRFIARNQVALAVAAALVPFAGAQSQTTTNTLPTGGVVAAGTATITQPAANKLQIDQASDKAVLNWQSFSIGSGAWVNFTQPSASAIALNRVMGTNPSEILGRLSANGQVFLSNPSGVLFAPGASVDVGGLFATTLSIEDGDFLAGRYNFANAGGAGSVVNQGVITATGYAALAGPQVRNDGVIVAQSGTVALAAGERVSLDMVGDGLISISVDQAAMNASAINSGTIQADGGRVVLTARSANALLDTVVNNGGVIQANSLVERNGEVVLDGGSAGVVSSTGTLRAAGVGAGTTGGTITVSGDKVAITGGTVDASGDSGGGSVGIGRGGSATFVGSDAMIRADATRSGNGGHVETSGAYLELGTAPQVGAGGTWLIDPYNIQIVSGAGSVNNAGAPNFTPNGDSSQIGATLIVNQLNSGTNVVVDTGGAGSPGGQLGDLIVSASIVKTNVNAAGLTLNAANNLEVNAPITLNAGTFHASAGHDMTVRSNVTASNMSVATTGALTLDGGGVTDAQLLSSGGQMVSASSLALRAQNNRRATIQNTVGDQSVTVGAGGIDLNVVGGSGVAQIASNNPNSTTFTTGTQTVSTTGALTVLGGSTTTGSRNSGVFQNQTGKQTVTAAGITLQAAAASNAQAGAFISTNGAQNGGGADQEINVAAGTISIGGGGIGLTNRASIVSSRNQTINGNADIFITGGTSGIGTNDSGTNNRASIAANNGTQTIFAHDITLKAGAGGTDTSATITGATQSIAASGDVRITGGSNDGSSNGARIGAPEGISTNLTLQAHNVTLTGGTTDSGAAIGNSGNSPGLQNTIKIVASGDVRVNGGDGNGARIGSPNGDIGGGSIDIDATGDIVLDGGVHAANIRTGGELKLHGASISEIGNTEILANALIVNTSTGAIDLTGGNAVGRFDAWSAGDVRLNNAGALEISGLIGTAATVTNAGSVNLSASTFLPSLSLATTGTSADLLVTGNVFAGTGMDIDVSGTLSVLGATPGVLASLSSGGVQNIHAAGLAVTAQNGGFASLSSNAIQSIAIAGGSVDVQASGHGSAQVISGGPQTISVVDGDHLSVNGADGVAFINTNTGLQTISLTGSGRNALTVGSTAALGTSQLFATSQLITAGAAGESGSVTVVGPATANAAQISTAGSVGGTQSISTSGQLTIAGGSSSTFSAASILHGGSGQQSIAAGAISITGGETGNRNAGTLVSGGGGDQTIDVGGDFRITAGSAGTGNRASVSSNGNQTINVGGDLVITGGAGGGGHTNNGTSNGAFIQASNPATEEKISARNITLNAGSGGNDTFASITAAHQAITASEDVRLNGGSNISIDGSGARIGGLRSPAGPTNLTLKARDVILTGGTMAGNGAALGNNAEILQGQTITIDASRDVILASGSGAGARIGANNDKPALPGDIKITAGRDIKLSGVDHATTIRTTGNVNLTAGGAISEAPKGWIAASALTTSSFGATDLAGPNQVASFNGTSGAAMALANTGDLSVTGITAGGTLDLASAGTLTVSASGLQNTIVSSNGGQTITADALHVHAQDDRIARIINFGGDQAVDVGAGGVNLEVLNGQGVAQIVNGKGALTNGTQTVTTSGLLNVVGGATSDLSGTNSGVFQSQSGKQTVTAGSISLQAADAAVRIGGALIINTDGGPGSDQEVNVASGTIRLTGGGTGFNNRAAIQTFGNQTINGNADIFLTGGSSGSGTNSQGGANAALISANTAGKTQTISAHDITLQAGLGGTDTSAAITADMQTITATGDVSLTGGANAGTAGGARIGASGGSRVGSNVTLTAHNVTVTGGDTTAAAIGNTSNARTPNLPNRISITASGDVVLQSGAGNGARIGAPNGDSGAGTVSIDAAGTIALNGGAHGASIRTAGDVILHAASISETGKGRIEAGSLSLATPGTAALGGDNTISRLNATTGDMTLANTGPLEIVNLSASGASTVNNAGLVTLSGFWNAPSVSLSTTGPGADFVVTGSLSSFNGMELDVGGALVVDAHGLGALPVFPSILSYGGPQTFNVGALSVTARNGGNAVISQSGFGGQTINVTGGSIDVRTLEGGGSASIGASGPQVINVVNGDHFSVDAAGGGSAFVSAFGTSPTDLSSQTISLMGSGRNAFTLGSAGALGFSNVAASVQSITAGRTGEQGSITMVGSPLGMVGLSTTIAEGSSQTLSTSGALNVLADNAFAQVFGGGGQNISADSIHLIAQNGGNAAILNVGGDQRIVAGDGGIELNAIGGSGTTFIANARPSLPPPPPDGVPLPPAPPLPPSNGVQSIDTTGDLIVLGGSTVSRGSGSSVSQNQSGQQTIEAGNITVRAADSGSNGGAFISASGGGDQAIDVESGAISVTAGSGGFGNRAAISTTANQTILGNADLLVAGGAGGTGTATPPPGSPATQNSASVGAGAGKVQTIYAHSVSVKGGDGNDTFATLTGATQVINTTGDVTVNGGAGTGTTNGARIGGVAGGDTHLTIHAENVVLAAGASTGARLGGPLGASTANYIDVHAAQDVKLNASDGAVARIGASGTLLSAGEVTISAGRNIELNGAAQAASIRTSGNVALNAGESISENSDGGIRANQLTTISGGSTLLGGANQVAAFNATSTGGSVLLTNTGALDVTGLNAFGDATLDNTGNVTISGPWSAGGTTSITVHSDLLLLNALHSHDVFLTATSGSIEEGGGGAIDAASLTTSSVGSTTLSGDNTVSTFSAASGGGITLNNTGPLTVSSLQASGAIELTNDGSLKLDTPVDTTGQLTLASHGDLRLTDSVTAGDLVVRSRDGNVTIGGADLADSVVLHGTRSLTLEAPGQVLVRGSDCTIGAGAYALSDGALTVNAGSFTLVGGAAPFAPALAAGDVVNVTTAGNLTLTGGMGTYSPALLLGGTGINLTVGGTLRINGGVDDTSFARVQTATRDGAIHITFTNEAGDYVVDGLDGRIKHGQDGFYTGIKPAKPGDSFFVTYE